MPRRSTEAKNLDNDEWNIYENLTQLNKVTEEQSQQQAEEHSQQQARRAYTTAGENQKNRKSSANCRPKRTMRTTFRRKLFER